MKMQYIKNMKEGEQMKVNAEKLLHDFDKKKEVLYTDTDGVKIDASTVLTKQFRFIVKKGDATLLNADGVSELFIYNMIKHLNFQCVPFDMPYYYEIFEDVAR